MAPMSEARRDQSCSLPAWSAVIINWNGARDLPTCLTALAAQTWPATLIVVVDNASQDDSLAVLERYPAVRRLAQVDNLGFAGGANVGIQATQTELVATLNPDICLAPDWAAQLAEAFAAEPGLAAAGGKLLYPDGVTIQHAGGQLTRPLFLASHIGRGETDRGQYDQVSVVDFLTGGALMLRRSALDQIGLWDAGFYPAYYEDVDLCLRLQAAGWTIRYLPGATGLHAESSSVDVKSAAYYRMVHAGRLRVAAKHLPLPALIGDFLPSEVGRLTTELQHLTGALADDQAGLTVFPAGLQLEPIAPRSTGQPPPVASEALTAIDSRAADPGVHSGVAASREGGQRRVLLERLAELRQRWLVEERPFVSTVPLMGRLIARLRTAVNDLGPRWYGQQLLAQQVEFNASVYRGMAEMTAAVQAGELGQTASGTLLATHIERLTTQQAELIARLAALEARLAALEERRASGGDRAGDRNEA